MSVPSENGTLDSRESRCRLAQRRAAGVESKERGARGYVARGQVLGPFKKALVLLVVARVYIECTLPRATLALATASGTLAYHLPVRKCELDFCVL